MTQISIQPDVGRALKDKSEDPDNEVKKFVPPRKSFLSVNDELSATFIFCLGLLGFIGWLVAWEIVHHLTPEVRQKFVPSASQVIVEIYNLIVNEGFLSHIGKSLYRIYVSFAAACLVAVPIGVLMGTSAQAKALLNPTIGAWRYLPAASFVPLLLIYFGPTDVSKLALLFLGCIFFLIALILDDVLSVPKEFVESSQTMGASHLHILLRVVFPAAAPRILDSMRNMIAVSWTYLVIAEIVAATDGIGAVMMRASRFLHVDTIMAGILTIGILGVVTDIGFRIASRLLFPYTHRRR
jgi:NitT/TauT family transport system permease protein